jgi:aspartate kinase
VIVMKFGGTSVKDQTAIERLIGIVRAERQAQIQPERADLRGPIVVVSALSGVTDRLLGIAAEAGAGDAEGARENVRALRERHHTVAQVIRDTSLRASVDSALDHEFDELDRIVGALSVLCEVSPRWLDALAAMGEILSSQIVAAALTSHGLAASWVDARKGIVTNDEFTSAAPLLPETQAALTSIVDPLLADRRIPVIGGFVGATLDGVTTTLGRGGSDYSGALVGACLGAEEIQIWTDVDGMLTADPRIIKEPQVVPHLSFAEASELAYFGAKVLHPATIQPAVAANIPVRILNSQRPAARGTLITETRPPAGGPLTAIASKTGVTVVDITSTRMLMTHGFLRRLFGVFEKHRTPVDVVTTSEVSVSVTVDDQRRLPAIVAELSEFAEVSCAADMAILCAVGDGIRTDRAIAGELLAAIDGVPLRMVSQAASRRNVTVVIGAADLPSALTRLHAAFFSDETAGPKPRGYESRVSK